jgi:hypothetical protein
MPCYEGVNQHKTLVEYFFNCLLNSKPKMKKKTKKRVPLEQTFYFSKHHALGE